MWSDATEKISHNDWRRRSAAVKWERELRRGIGTQFAPKLTKQRRQHPQHDLEAVDHGGGTICVRGQTILGGEGRLFGTHCRITIASSQTRARERLKSLVLNSVTTRLG